MLTPILTMTSQMPPALKSFICSFDTCGPASASEA